MTVCEMLSSCLRMREALSCRRVSVSAFIDDCCNKLPRYHHTNSSAVFLSLSPDIGITLPRFHEWRRAQADVRPAEPGDGIDAASNGTFSGAQTGRVGIASSSLA